MNRMSELIASLPKALLDSEDAIKELKSWQAPAKDTQSPSAAACESVAIIAVKLAQVSTKIAQLHDMAKKVSHAGTDVGEDARKWQNLSVTALEWSRSMMQQQQQQCLEKLLQGMSLDEAGTLPAAAKLTAPPGLSPPSLVGSQAVLVLTANHSYSEQPHTLPLQSDEQMKRPLDTSPASDLKTTGTLRAHLEELRTEDPKKIMIVRRINRLGFQSPELLAEHFTQFGGVARILVAHLCVKPSSRRPVPRIRPAGLGFVVVNSEEVAEQVLAAESHVINGIEITIEKYRDQHGLETVKDDVEADTER